MGVFRIFQETLTNVARHAECTAVEIGLVYGADGLVLRVADNGKGIQASCLDDEKSLGILGMKERAESLGGEVTFHLGSPSGTVVELELPLASHDTLTIPNAG
jgi:signal transduction histidine kinase